MRKNPDDEWGDVSYGGGSEGPPRESVKPSVRLWEAFKEVVTPRVHPSAVLRSSAQKTYANINWMLGEGWSEAVIRDSFKVFASYLPAISPSAVLWDEYFRRKTEMLRVSQEAQPGRRRDEDTAIHTDGVKQLVEHSRQRRQEEQKRAQ